MDCIKSLWNSFFKTQAITYNPISLSSLVSIVKNNRNISLKEIPGKSNIDISNINKILDVKQDYVVVESGISISTLLYELKKIGKIVFPTFKNYTIFEILAEDPANILPLEIIDVTIISPDGNLYQIDKEIVCCNYYKFLIYAVKLKIYNDFNCSVYQSYGNIRDIIDFYKRSNFPIVATYNYTFYYLVRDQGELDVLYGKPLYSGLFSDVQLKFRELYLPYKYEVCIPIENLIFIEQFLNFSGTEIDIMITFNKKSNYLLSPKLSDVAIISTNQVLVKDILINRLSGRCKDNITSHPNFDRFESERRQYDFYGKFS